jgi:hypothetical protein
VASSYRAVKAVWTSYGSLYKHFVTAADNTDLDSKDRSSFHGLANKLSSTSFFCNLALMKDALEELAYLSEALQVADITVHRAVRLIARQIEVFSSRKECGGSAYEVAEAAIATGVFEGVKLKETTRGNARIHRGQFYQALVDSMKARLLPQTEDKMVNAVQLVLPNRWEESLSAEYGEAELKWLCSYFGTPYSGQLKQEYRDYKDTKGRDVGLCMKRFLIAVDTLPVSTASCERGFSSMNVICTPLRSTLTVTHLASLMFLSIEGPPIHMFDPSKYAQLWIARGRHAATDFGKCKQPKAVDVLPGQLAIWKCL